MTTKPTSQGGESFLENNRLIAEFMDVGYIMLKNAQFPEPFPHAMEIHHGGYQPLAYHTSWDWLMPVVEKIESLGFKIVIMQKTCSIYNAQYNVNTFEAETKLESVYNHVVDFIQWHNSLTPPSNTKEI